MSGEEPKEELDGETGTNAARQNGVESPEELNNPYFIQTAAKATKKGRKLPDFLNHFNAKDLKILFKCSIAVWVFTLFIFINPTLKLIGQATFFGSIILFIFPPSGIVLIQLMAATTLVVGMALAWAWGVITMKAALATRSAAEVNAKYQQLLQSIPQNTTNVQQASGQSAYIQIAIFQGYMLDTRVTLTYFFMLCLFIYFVARVRVAAPKLIMLQLFAIIVSDTFLTIAPLIPSFNGTLPRTLILPAAIGIAVGLACNILFFPQSAAYVVMDGIRNLLSPMSGFLEACQLNFKHPSSRMDLAYLTKFKAQLTQIYQTLEPNVKFLPMDASVGRWNGEDLTNLQPALRQVVVGFLGLLHFQMGREEYRDRDEKLVAMAEAIHDDHHEKAEVTVGHHQISRAVDFRLRSRRPDAADVVQKGLGALEMSCGPILTTCQECFKAVDETLADCNSRRWFGRSSEAQIKERTDRHDALLAKLKEDLKEFSNLSKQYLLKSHEHLFDEKGQLIVDRESNQPPPISGLMLGLIFEEKVLLLAQALDSLFGMIIELEKTRTTTRLWLPTGLRHLFHWAFDKDRVPGGTPTLDDDDLELEKLNTQATQKRPKKVGKKGKSKKAAEEPTGAKAQLTDIAHRRGRERSRAGQILVNIINWLSNTEGLYALRILIVTIALGVPAVIPSSAGFYYREKGLWALIMAQMGMVLYTADFVFGLVLRLVGTIIGGVLGLVCWYIGSGDGTGNAYGMAAIMAVVIIIFMWCRLFASPVFLQGIMLMSATCNLVVAYSWVDSHIPSYGNPGLGYSVFWRRMLLVIIGFAAAALVTFLPKPPSAGRHYRRLLSESLTTIKHRYALLVANWDAPASDLSDIAQAEALATTQLLLSIAGPIKLTKFEFSTSNIDSETLSFICKMCISLNQATTQLLISAATLSTSLRERFSQLSSAFDERLIGDLMAVLTLVQQSLRTGEPLPAILPTPLLARSFDYSRQKLSGDFHSVLFDQSMIEDDEFRKYCLLMNAWVQLLGSIDELVMIVKRSVGETSYVDLERQQQ